MSMERITISWKQFKDAIPDRTEQIYVTKPNGTFLDARRSCILENVTGGGFLFHYDRLQSVDECMEWKWCYAKDIVIEQN